MRSVVSRASGVLVALIGVVGFIGWATGIRKLASASDNFIPMAPNTALAFVLLGAALFARSGVNVSSSIKTTARIAAGFVLGLCSVRLIDHLFGAGLETDQWIFQMPGG